MNNISSLINFDIVEFNGNIVNVNLLHSVFLENELFFSSETPITNFYMRKTVNTS